jgi:hypothetical protein
MGSIVSSHSETLDTVLIMQDGLALSRRSFVSIYFVTASTSAGALV